LRFTIDYLIGKFKYVYIPEENVAIDEYLTLWKGRLSFRIYIPTKRERYGIKLSMLCESETGYLRNFIVYTGASTLYPPPVTINLTQNFEDYKSPSKVVLNLMDEILNQGYCLTLDNYFS